MGDSTEVSTSAGSAPTTVTRAVTCLAASTALAAILIVLSLVGVVRLSPGASNVSNIITCAFLAVATWRIAAGKGWARWLFIAIYVFGSLAGGVVLLLEPDVFRVLPAALIGSAFAQLAIQTAAVVFLLRAPAREWFKTKRSGASSSRI
jgi:hypothetical protein